MRVELIKGGGARVRTANWRLRVDEHGNSGPVTFCTERERKRACRIALFYLDERAQKQGRRDARSRR